MFYIKVYREFKYDVKCSFYFKGEDVVIVENLILKLDVMKMENIRK